MAKQGGMGDLYLVSGTDISGDVGALSNVHGGPALSDVTDITQSGISRIGLLRDGGLTASVWFDTVTAHPVLSLLPTADVQCSYGIGRTIGAPMASCVAKQVNYDGARGQDASYTLSVDWQASAGTGLEWGQQLTAGKRTDTAATNGASLDGTAATSFGAAAYLHVVSVTGTSVTVTIEDSANDSTWAAVSGLAFTAVLGAATSGQRVTTTTTTTTLRRYVRAVTTGTFSSAIFTVNLVRYATAQA